MVGRGRSSPQPPSIWLACVECCLVSLLVLRHPHCSLQTCFPGTEAETALQSHSPCSLGSGLTPALSPESQLQACGGESLADSPGRFPTSLELLLPSLQGYPPSACLCSVHTVTLMIPLIRNHPHLPSQLKVHKSSGLFDFSIFCLKGTSNFTCAKQSWTLPPPHCPHPIKCFFHVLHIIIHQGVSSLPPRPLPFPHSLQLAHHPVYRFYFHSIS